MQDDERLVLQDSVLCVRYLVCGGLSRIDVPWAESEDDRRPSGGTEFAYIGDVGEVESVRYGQPGDGILPASDAEDGQDEAPAQGRGSLARRPQWLEL